MRVESFLMELCTAYSFQTEILELLMLAEGYLCYFLFVYWPIPSADKWYCAQFEFIIKRSSIRYERHFFHALYLHFFIDHTIFLRLRWDFRDGVIRRNWGNWRSLLWIRDTLLENRMTEKNDWFLLNAFTRDEKSTRLWLIFPSRYFVVFHLLLLLFSCKILLQDEKRKDTTFPSDWTSQGNQHLYLDFCMSCEIFYGQKIEWSFVLYFSSSHLTCIRQMHVQKPCWKWLICCPLFAFDSFWLFIV